MVSIVKKYFWAGLLCLLFVSGCRPEGIIPPDDMVSLFTGFYEADACIESAEQGRSEMYRRIDSLRVYRPILAQYGYTAEDFRASLRYYLTKPDELSDIFDKVCDRLTKLSEEAERQAALEAEKAEVEEVAEGVDKEDRDMEEPEEPDRPEVLKERRPAARPVDTVQAADTVKPVEPAEAVKPDTAAVVSKPAVESKPAVDSQPAERKGLRKKVTRNDLKRLEEELKK